MKNKFLYGLIIVTVLSTFFFCGKGEDRKAQYKCNCSQIGIDSAWADSNKVACYKVPVKQVYDKNSSRNILMAVAIAKASDVEAMEPLLYLHGGPGISTLVNVKRYINSPAWKLIRKKHDLIFFDYRGTGFSQPELCSALMDSLTSFGKSNPSREEYSKKEIDLFRECRLALAKEGVELESFNSQQMAADAESIRVALNISKWNVYGVSYGTFIALKYVKHFPGHLNSLVLDSPFPPNTPWLDFVRPMDTALSQLQNKLLEDSSIAGNFPDIKKDLGKAVRRLNSKPVKINGINYYGDEFAGAVQRAMLKPSAIPLVPLAIREVANGNDSVLNIFKEKFGTSSSFGKYSYVQQMAMLCYESRPQNPEDKADSLAKKYPDLVSFNLAFNEQLCDVFRPQKPDKKYFEPVVSDLPVLIIGGEFDPVTPPYFGKIASQSLPNAQVMIVPGASHAVLHFNECTMNRVDRFLENPFHKPGSDCNSDMARMVFVTSEIESHLKKLK